MSAETFYGERIVAWNVGHSFFVSESFAKWQH